MKAAKSFLETLDRLITDENCFPEQTFHMDKTSLFWKWMPENTFIHKEAKSMPSFKAFKDRIRVLLGGCVTGCKLKPFVIWHSETPGPSSRSVSKHASYHRDSKSWTILPLFQDALLNCYAREIERYYVENRFQDFAYCQ